MRAVVLWLVLAAAVAEYADEPWVEEEDVEEPYDEDTYTDDLRRKRDTYADDPFAQHIRVKRKCNGPCRVRRNDFVRVPRQVHQYEVHEFTDEGAGPVPPYEEMLTASANHYQRYAVPAPSPRYLHEPAQNVPISIVTKPANFVPNDPIAVGSPVQFVAQPLPASIPLDQPLPVASEAIAQPLKKLSDEDSFGAAAHHHHQHGGHGHEQGGGHAKHGHHYNEHGGGGTKGSQSDHYLDKGNKGFRTDHLHRKEYEDAQGKKRKHHDNADHKGSHEEEAHGSRGSHFGEKKGHKKGHKTKGYHNKYHKDEFKKEHKFYDDFHKSGEHHRYGKFNAKHQSNESGKKKAHHVNAGHDFVERGKKGYSNKGHVDADHKGYDGKHGHEEHHHGHSQHAKKGGDAGGSHWGYAKKH